MLDDDKPVLTGVIDDSRAGDLLPAIEVRDPAGKALNLGALQGQPVLINLWATWCAPCVVEMPMLDDLAQDLGDDIRVLTISQDLQGAEVVEPFFAKMKFASLKPWLDADNKLMTATNADNFPTTILYDASGREVWRVTGDYDWSSAETQEAITAAIEE